MSTNQNKEVLKQLNDWVVKSATSKKEIDNFEFVHDVTPIEWLFILADQKGIDLESKLPEKTRKGNTSLSGRICTFFTESKDELNRRTDKNCRRTLSNGSWTHRGIPVEEVEEFTMIVKRKLFG
jgi:hypothetical protein